MESAALNPGNLMFGIVNVISVDDDRMLKLDAVKDFQSLANIRNSPNSPANQPPQQKTKNKFTKSLDKATTVTRDQITKPPALSKQ
ncbi:hypothetical protein L873DRAFT_1823057 [Choiromyces venosus 120613-1]|uniref:Uncharacterized protein n=1 Tax=Choiromyces venosus 120613-1 TaxID=1336337 RepID=A0A3N4IU66_9PEZI|nr:hypothetical protein L873DRAFT_1823057 [Choiromyces venosus 120613-1]